MTEALRHYRLTVTATEDPCNYVGVYLIGNSKNRVLYLVYTLGSRREDIDIDRGRGSKFSLKFD